MERYFVTKEDKEIYIEKYPVLECDNAVAVMYDDDYITVKCTKLLGVCTYKSSKKDEYKNCKVLSRNS